MKYSASRLGVSTSGLVVALLLATLTDDVIVRNLCLAVSIFSVVFALQSLASLGLGKDHE
ncbi:MAG: hypothetical protein ACKOA1_06505 [Bacteroidota bacterium]